jgi:DUF2917 family protein
MDAIRLKQNGTLRIEKAAGVVVEVSKGEVWLTQAHDPRDHFLRAGDWLRIDRQGTVVISATGDDAWIALTELAPGHLQSLLLAPGPSLT